MSQDNGDRVQARNEQLAITARPIAVHLAKQQARINRNALQCDTRNFFYFRRRSSGRVCSCMLGDDNTPNGTCLVCFNTGCVGGYDKYGTQTEVVDITHPTLVLTNVKGNYDSGTRTTFFVLDEDAKVGMIQATINIRKTQNNYVDQLMTYDNSSTLGGDGVIDYLCREYGTNTWRQWSTETVQSILNTESATKLEVCIYLRRRSLNTVNSPCFSHLYLRYGLLPEKQAAVNLDIPRNTETITLQEYGFDEQMGTMQMFTDSKITTYSLGDFFYYIDGGKFWALTEVQPLKTMGVFVSFDLTARYMQKYEIATQVPV